MKLKLNKKTETELIKHFDSGDSLELYFRFGTGAISNAEIKNFVNLKNRGWYQTIRNKIYGPPIPKISKKAEKVIVFNDDDEVLD